MTRIDPGLPVKAVGASNRAFVSGGRLMVETEVEVDPEVWEQYRQGYRCIRCHAVQEEPFPERCIEHSYGICSFPIRDRQLEVIEKTYADNTHPGDEELDSERALWEANAEEGQGLWTPDPDAIPPNEIWLPE